MAQSPCDLSADDTAVIIAPINQATSKEFGAYYTSPVVARFLVNWAVRSAEDHVIDPSFGGGVFLQAAAERIRELSGDPATLISGIELDQVMHRATSAAAQSYGIRSDNLLHGDFFGLAGRLPPAFDAVVGNPPFIRYQQFSGAARERAAILMKKHGVRMSGLASSWAPFIVGAAGLLRPGGRLAMVAPMELCHASYSRCVLEFLSRSFGVIHFLSFQKRLFPELSQDTLLVLADQRGCCAEQIHWRHLRESAALGSLVPRSFRIPRARKLDAAAVAGGRERLIEQFLPARARALLSELRDSRHVVRLGAVADVGIGYVTGGNSFFHLSAEQRARWDIPERFLRPAVVRGRGLKGLRFTRADWDEAFASGDAALLLSVPRGAALPGSVKRYLNHGESAGVHEAYKCRTREPWYTVPNIYQADAFLTYMSGVAPRMVANDAAAVAPNTLHVVRARPLCGLRAHQLVVAWQSSLTQLSAEVEGHAMGGGLLKLEPLEAQRVLLPLPGGALPDDPLGSLDTLARHGRNGIAQATVDRMILQKEVGLSQAECRILQNATELLRVRRLPQRN